MTIRESSDADKPAIFDVHLNAFDESEAQSVARLAMDLLEEPAAMPLLSLVATIDEQVAGHILFTPVSVKEAEIRGGYILAPLAVLPEFQNQGIGKALIVRGLDRLKQRGAAFVLVLGDPAYYAKSGFKTGHRLDPPYPLEYPEAWMALALESGVLESLEGKVRCAPPLQAEEYW